MRGQWEVITVESARSRRHVILSALTALLTVIVGGVLADHFVLQAEWWQVNRTVTHAPQPPLADLGPPATPVTASWQLSTPVGDSDLPAYDRVAYTVMDGQLVIVSGHGLDVRDARTGWERWHYHRAEWSVLGWARTGQVLVAYLERTGHRGDRLMVGLDAVSGTLLWRQQGDVPAATDRTTLRWPAAGGVVFVTGDGRHTLYGRSATTGRRLWTKRLPHGCLLPEAVPYASGSSDTIAAFSIDCGASDRVLVVDRDPRSGRARFTVLARNTARSAVAVGGDVTAVFDGSSLDAFDRSGRRFLHRAGQDLCRDMCPIAVTEGHLLIAYEVGRRPEDATPTRRLESVDIASGSSSWHRDMPGYTALAVSGGLVYGLRSRLADPLLPAGVDVIDPISGTGTTVPIPLVLRAGLDGVRPWLAAGGGMLYVAAPAARPRPFGAGRLVVLRGGVRGEGPPELSGVPADKWPDACSLLPKRDLPRGYAGEPAPTTVDGLRLPAGCTFRPRHARGRGPDGPEREAGVLSVTVQWVSVDAATAKALFAAARDTQNGTRDPVRAGEEAYAIGTSSGTVVMRVGRTIVTVTSGVPDTATRMAAVVAARLRTA
ncbi:PQQ-binding-like beta-propeller repeat protein [Actinoallomurus purpureus]|uniref:outer membrane protein assembly factor BamB family protein n=1 Tax=Actinoallomurus purpureus TaxID=478114 RepID=UPI002092CB66|nr:PQQ-binding-like beta-propeller repeat protein [Actinoallomurus purpureus]MCO6004824.1 PQQ-binding-like beta-propeller repeat protein [Actinoallomurus purpureus]